MPSAREIMERADAFHIRQAGSSAVLFFDASKESGVVANIGHAHFVG